ncbi:PD-(D/E)XK nuclease family protein [Oceanirhabdus sp. W0125-5]|uniref:PD-(D/E)XK nuclease family protein n=1 Tax=Oceanirhabdus sp. W0125-5 TaxID=2999116 RepID=UPI0022F33544|nr:PD-(D/E)XK nuclease family protein [Oceanirhabdus sp. W0125-5]WBW96230.1 PD-(D/E)XK nuclease family protein [Oceanirhabdus sp. W0125-5]
MGVRPQGNKKGGINISSIFNRLLSLYSKNSNANKTPLEDFTTEILVGLLESDASLLDKFTNNILDVQGENFRIRSQKKYYVKDDMDCIIDVVIENDEVLCFLENKVNSKEGYKQLQRYTTLLNNIEKEQNKKVYLRYCTKYYDEKDITDIDFKQFRWNHIYKFLSDYSEDKFVKEYMDFLRSENMAGADNFNIQDLMVLSNINSTFSKINQCIDTIKPKFKELFGQPSRSTGVNTLGENNGYWIWSNKKLADGQVVINLGFWFEDGHEIPALCVELEYGKSKSKYEELKRVIKEMGIDDMKEEEGKASVWFSEDLSSFFKYDNQLERIEEWFVEKLDIIDKLLRKVGGN